MRFLNVILFFVSFSLFSQRPVASISSKKVDVGGRVNLVYKIELKKNDKFEFKQLRGTFPAKLTSLNSDLKTAEFNEVEIISFQDSIINKGNTKTWIGLYELTPWDSGLIVLEGQRFSINDSTFDFQAVYLECNLVAQKKGQGIYDIKETFAEIPERQTGLIFFIKYIAWWLIPLIGFLVYKYIINKRNSKISNVEKELSLKDRTLLAISALEKSELWNKDQLKEHFVELSYILRSYLTSRYSISLLDKTTSETKLLLSQKGLKKEIVSSILSLLSHSDMVKFAASEPAEELIHRTLFLLRQIVSETSPIEFPHAE